MLREIPEYEKEKRIKDELLDVIVEQYNNDRYEIEYPDREGDD